MAHIENKHIFRTLGPIVLMPEDLSGSRELGASSTCTSSSDMFINHVLSDRSVNIDIAVC